VLKIVKDIFLKRAEKEPKLDVMVGELFIPHEEEEDCVMVL